MTKPKYFDPTLFVDAVLREFELDTVEDHTDLRLEITQTLGDRIMTTVINSFSQKEFQRLKKIQEDHPELSTLDAIMMVAPDIEGLDEKLKRNIDSLFQELVHDAKKVKELLKSDA